MDGQKKRIRRDYAPLSVSVSLSVGNATSTYTQVYNPDTTEYDPDRSLSPLVIQPVVSATASDGSWPSGQTQQYLAQMKWYVNGKDITTQEAWTGAYEISEETDATRGQIKIKRNVKPSERFTLRFEGVIADGRLGVNVPVISEEVVLYTFEKGGDSWNADIGESQIIRYDPFKDKLFRYDYQKAHGITPTDTQAAAEGDINAYLRKIHVNVYRGKVKVSTGFTIEYNKVSGTTLTPMTLDADDEVRAMDATGITLDLRLVEKADYVAVVKVSSKEVARVQFSVNRVYQPFTCVPADGAAINADDTVHRNEAMVNADGRKIINPESIIKIDWYTDTAAKTGTHYNEGRVTTIPLADTGIGAQWPDDWMDVYTKAGQKPVHSVATDGTNVYIDEDGNELIFN